MLDLQPQCFSSDCPSRALFDQIADKWSMMVLAVLDDGPLRFNAIKRRLQDNGLNQCPAQTPPIFTHGSLPTVAAGCLRAAALRQNLPLGR